MKIGIKPTGHMLLVLPLEVEVTTKSGIVLATATQTQRESMAQTEAIVIALGNTAYADQAAPWCAAGDKVVFARYAGTICQGKDGQTYRLINDLDVKALLEKDDE
jgi:chaperonin GroES